MFIAPMFIVHRSVQKSFSMKISLKSFLDHAVDPCKSQLSLLNRQFNKQLFLQNVKHLLLNKKLSLSQISKIFVKINSVYKQASIERGSIRKQTAEVTCFQKENFSSEQLLAIDLLIIQLQRLGRLRANTSFRANAINAFLTESAPSNRVLSGEAIIFQNETHEIFREIINASENPLEPDLQDPAAPKLKVRYVCTVLLEFLRSVLENQIPLQPAQ